MVFVDVVVVALVVGRLLGGRFGALGEVPIRGTGLAFAAIGLQLVAFPYTALPWRTPDSVARLLWLASYALLVMMLLRNLHLRSTLVVAAGLVCNLAAIVANGGLMPVRASALAAAGRVYHVHNNSIELVKPRLGMLVDRWAVPHWIPLGNVFSVGDVLIAVGTFAAVVLAMRAFPASSAGGVGAVLHPAPADV